MGELLYQKAKERAYFMYINNEHPELNDEGRFLLAINEQKKDINKYNELSCVVCRITFGFEWQYKCSCKCCVCKKCIEEYILNRLSEMNYLHNLPKFHNVDVKCIAFCNNRIKIADYISEDLYQNNLPNKLEIPDGKIFNILYCVKPDCSGKLKDDECETCKTKVCFKCNQKKHDGECDKNAIKDIMDAIEIGGTLQTSMCPNCNQIIFKHGGCSTMFCWNCCYMFDWDGKILPFYNRTDDLVKSGKSYYSMWKDSIKNNKPLTRFDR